MMRRLGVDVFRCVTLAGALGLTESSGPAWLVGVLVGLFVLSLRWI